MMKLTSRDIATLEDSDVSELYFRASTELNAEVFIDNGEYLVVEMDGERHRGINLKDLLASLGRPANARQRKGK